MAVNGASAAGRRGPSDDERAKIAKYLTFKLGGEEYGLPLMRVREIIALMEITKVPLTPSWVRGVMNLRGKVIPVIDLRRKLGMEPSVDHDRKCIIVVDVRRSEPSIQTRRSEPSIQMSILVDAVCEVLGIAVDTIEKAPAMSATVDVSFIDGVAMAKSGVKLLLDVDAVLAGAGLPHHPIAGASAEAEPSALTSGEHP